MGQEGFIPPFPSIPWHGSAFLKRVIHKGIRNPIPLEVAERLLLNDTMPERHESYIVLVFLNAFF